MKISICCVAFVLGLAAPVPAAAQSLEKSETAAQSAGAADDLAFSGTAREVHQAGTYTYVRITPDPAEGGDEAADLWLAGPHTEVAVGERVSAPAGARMQDFRSRHLDRQFDVIYLVSALNVEGRAAPTPSIAEIHAGHSAPAEGAAAVSELRSVEGGLRIGQIFARREALANSEVLVRGRVVKVTRKVMGKNWLHLQDGSAGPGGEIDLTVSTSDSAAIGDVVLVRGTVVLDRDFGYGYRYELLIEASALSVE